ncbi:glutamate--cysteine ligase [Marinobacter daqiaonensis]|uniref:Glutamate--cysteine ligase n=1 Tax=Marinobacter daqiaonensis TaxID=650891 RepID=A0A1I6JG92_9GAMM|nr:glutamate-cysteine ligase family protein [Marinobacter daqiaonensis]SFR77904.1 glutamate--cysteine ligase [Marinobacter daqiaonensis]
MTLKVEHTGQLVDDLASNCKPAGECLIGVEHEKFVFTREGQHPLPYAGDIGIHALLTELQQAGWKPTHDRDRLVGLSADKAAITLEPAGQLELSGAPWSDLHDVCREMQEHRRQLGAISQSLGVDFLALGFSPTWTLSELDWMPHSRYHIMRRYMPGVGVHGRDMMTRTSSFQLNFDFCSEQDMCDKYRVAMALQPLVMVALANAPFAEGRDTGLTSYRNYVWLHTDSARCGIMPEVFSRDFGFDAYVNRALATPMYSVKRKGAHQDLAGRYFTDMLKAQLPELPGEQPTLSDWDDHLNTLMHDVRLKDHLELRGSDTLDLEQSMALAAFWTGILYDSHALQGALKLIEACDPARLNQLRHSVPWMGLSEMESVGASGVFQARSLLDALEQAVALAESGLEKRRRQDAEHADERRYLEPLKRVMEARMSPAEQWRKRFREESPQDLSFLYEEALF